LALVEERLLSPKFTADAFNRLKRQRIESFKQSKSQPAAIASSVFSMVNYGKNSIFGISQNGTEETIGNMTLEDIQGYYDNNITTDGMNVVVVGDVKEDEVLPKLSFLNKLPNKKNCCSGNSCIQTSRENKNLPGRCKECCAIRIPCRLFDRNEI